MKLKPGQKVYIGKRVYVGEIPDGIAAKAGLLPVPEQKGKESK